MTEEDLRGIMCTVTLELGYIYSRGLEPKRIYMNRATYSMITGQLAGQLAGLPVDWLRANGTLYGTTVAICDDLEDGETDISIEI